MQVEGVYTKALLDTRAHVTLLYRDFYNKTSKLEELKILGTGSEKFPYDGYIPIKIIFGPSIAGKMETFDTLLCAPDPRGLNKS